MARPLPVLFAVLAGFAVASACYSERQAPPTFRYSCDADSDCNPEERCIGGLCQVPCTQLNASEVCVGQNHLTCFNGVCSTGCDPTDKSPCPDSQECLDLGLTVSGGGLFGGGSEMMIGICGNVCTDDSCPENESCVELMPGQGVCLATCASEAECPPETVCFMTVCVPESFVPDDAGATNADVGTSAADETSGETTATTGGAT
jgi:hypothetical protein